MSERSLRVSVDATASEFCERLSPSMLTILVYCSSAVLSCVAAVGIMIAKICAAIVHRRFEADARLRKFFWMLHVRARMFLNDDEMCLQVWRFGSVLLSIIVMWIRSAQAYCK